MKRFCDTLWAGLITLIATFLTLAPVSAAQQSFATPEATAKALVVAVARDDAAALSALLGEDYADLLPSDADRADPVDEFLAAWMAFDTLQSTSPDTRMLAVGEHGWTLPIPIVRDDQGWHFDTERGRTLIRMRRIGANELSTIQAVLAYHDAQVEYAQLDRDGDGVLEYAQRFRSTPGTRDGLYWDSESAGDVSPLGPLLAEREPGTAYHGYFYRILTGQGANAPGGAEDYVERGNMTGGFGIVAWPAEYGDSGVMSFMMGRDGTVYEADLGPEGGKYAAGIATFDPDARWTPSLDAFDDVVDLR